MRSIVDTLETQHRALEQGVAALELALKANQLEQVRAELAKLCALLEAHLHLERTQFYPDFVARAGQGANPALGDIAQLFRANMETIAEGVLGFCRRFDKGIADRAGFQKEWRTTLRILAQRLSDEETTLHPMYRKLVTASP